MMWTRMRERIEAGGAETIFQSPVEAISWEPGRVRSVIAGGREFRAPHFISSMPLRELIEKLNPPAPEHVLLAAANLRFRAFLSVAAVIPKAKLFPELTIYVHDPEIAACRIQNYGNWSPEMAPDGATSCLAAEYFCEEHDALWDSPDSTLITMCTQDLARMGFARPEDVRDALVTRVRNAYPVCDLTCAPSLAVLREFLRQVPNLQVVGRNGMHRYCHQDQAMLSALRAARNVCGERNDVWG